MTDLMSVLILRVCCQGGGTVSDENWVLNGSYAYYLLVLLFGVVRNLH